MDHVLSDPVAPELTTWAKAIRADRSRFVLGYSEVLEFQGQTIVAKVEPHTFSGETGEHWDPPHPGVTLYERHDAAPGPVVLPAPAIGVDVSHYQKGATFESVAAAGYSFAMIKASEGRDVVDDQRATHFQRAGDAGLMRAPYHFFRMTMAPLPQMRRYIDVAGDGWELAHAIDLERQHNVPISDLDGHSAQEWCDAIADAVHELASLIGRRPTIYTGLGWWSLIAAHIDPAVYAECNLWVAAYTSSRAPTMPPGWPQWTFWQHTDKAHVPGIPGAADVDRFAGDLTALRALARSEPPDATDAGRILEIAKGVDQGSEGLG